MKNEIRRWHPIRPDGFIISRSGVRLRAIFKKNSSGFSPAAIHLGFLRSLNINHSRTILKPANNSPWNFLCLIHSWNEYSARRPIIYDFA